MTKIHSPDQLKELFTVAGYSMDSSSVETVLDYIDEAGIHLETDNNKLYMISGDNHEQTTLKNMLSFVMKENEKKFINDDLSSREYTNALIEAEQNLVNIKNNVIKRYEQLQKQTFKSGSAACDFAKYYREVINEYISQKDPELNYRFYTEKTAQKMLDSGKYPKKTVQNIVGLYAPEAIISPKTYGYDIVKGFAPEVNISNQEKKRGVLPR